MKKLYVIFSTLFFSILASFIYDWIKNIPIFSALKTVLFWLWNSVLNYGVKVWLLLILLVFYYIAKRVFRNLKTTKTASNSIVRTYKADTFHKQKWSWEWSYDYLLSKWIVSELKPLCKKCETKMYENEFHNEIWNCPRCKTQFRSVDTSKEVELMIIDNIDKKKL